MRRTICLFAILCLFLSGCSVLGERIKDPVTFYYIRADYQEDMDQVIASELREASGHRGDLPYLFALYLMGPSQEGLISPLPKGTRITPTEHTDEGIVLSLSEGGQTMTDGEFTLAGACLGLTCMELTEAEQITIICEDRSMTITAENLMILGDVLKEHMEEKS